MVFGSALFDMFFITKKKIGVRNMNNELYEIEYARWGKIVIKSQLIIASIVCLIEILNNFLLYLTRAQGYGPDTIVEKLVRYLFLTSAINFGLVWLRQYRIMGQVLSARDFVSSESGENGGILDVFPIFHTA